MILFFSHCSFCTETRNFAWTAKLCLIPSVSGMGGPSSPSPEQVDCPQTFATSFIRTSSMVSGSGLPGVQGPDQPLLPQLNTTRGGLACFCRSCRHFLTTPTTAVNRKHLENVAVVCGCSSRHQAPPRHAPRPAESRGRSRDQTTGRFFPPECCTQWSFCDVGEQTKNFIKDGRLYPTAEGGAKRVEKKNLHMHSTRVGGGASRVIGPMNPPPAPSVQRDSKMTLTLDPSLQCHYLQTIR